MAVIPYQPPAADVPQKILATIDRQTWLDAPSERVQELIHTFYDRNPPLSPHRRATDLNPSAPHARRWGDERGVRQRVEDFLHGTWLGHALHPVLTDVPLGAWLLGGVFDLFEAFGKRRYRAGADAALVVGLGGAVAAAASGLTDWQHLPGKTRRIGAVHALLNTAATALYVGSLVFRRRHQRGAGRALAWAGLAVSMGAAYLGGDLVSRQVGVDRTADLELPHDFVSVMPLDRLDEGRLHRAEANGVPVLLFRRGERIFALVERCAHLGGPLSEGFVEDESVICPWHGSRFALEDGRVLNGPSAYPQPCFETRVLNGLVQVRVARRSGHEV